MCDMTHSYVWHNSFICVTWLIRRQLARSELCRSYERTVRQTWMSHVTIHSYTSSTWFICMTHAWHDSLIGVTWLIHTCDMTHPRSRWQIARHDSFVIVIWLNHMCDMTQSWVRRVAHWHVWHDPVMCVTWLIYTWAMTQSCARRGSLLCMTRPIHMCDMTNLYGSHDSFICVTWLIHMCDMAHSYVWHDSFICVTWLIHMCDMTHSYVWHDTWDLIHLSVSHWHVWRDSEYNDSFIWYTLSHCILIKGGEDS